MDLVEWQKGSDWDESGRRCWGGSKMRTLSTRVEACWKGIIK